MKSDIHQHRANAMRRQSSAEASGAESHPPLLQPAEVAARLKASIRSLANSQYSAALEAARATPVAVLLDELALHDLVSLEFWMPQDIDNEHAQKTWESIENTKSATSSMRANYWLRRAMVYSKDFMLWDDAIKGEKFARGKPKGAMEPIPKRIHDFMLRNPKASSQQVWDELKKRPPKGYEFNDPSPRFGAYIRKPDGTEMKWGRFRNVVSEHRPKT